MIEHYYIVLFEAPNGRIVRRITCCERKDIFGWCNKNAFNDKILSVTKISKKEAKQLGYKF